MTLPRRMKRAIVLLLFVVGCSRSEPAPEPASSSWPAPLLNAPPLTTVPGKLSLTVEGKKPWSTDSKVTATSRGVLQVLAAGETRSFEVWLNPPLREGTYPVVTSEEFFGHDGGSKTGNARIVYEEGLPLSSWSATGGTVEVAFGKGQGMLLSFNATMEPTTDPALRRNLAKGTFTLSGAVDSKRPTDRTP